MKQQVGLPVSVDQSDTKPQESPTTSNDAGSVAACPESESDEPLSALAAQLLSESDAHNARDDRLVVMQRALVPLLRAVAVQSMPSSSSASHSIRNLPGWDDCAQWYKSLGANHQANERADFSEQSLNAHSSKMAFAPSELNVALRRAEQRMHKQFRYCQHPRTEYFRKLALLGANANLLCQCGCFTDARPIITYLSRILHSARTAALSSGQLPEQFLAMETIIASMAGVAIARGYPLLATALTRRLCANLGALARAAARLDGIVEPAFRKPRKAG